MDVATFQLVDRLSYLPENIIDHILLHLTLRDAARTSVLSKAWRHKWLKLPHLIFDLEHWKILNKFQEYSSSRVKFVEVLYQVLLRHQGPITKLHLTNKLLRGGAEVNHLIEFLSNSSVKEFYFHIQSGYKLPSSLFLCSELQRLNLSYCMISPPPSDFKGFNKLLSLELFGVTIDPSVLGKLISGCPLLEQLSLYFSAGEVGYVEIDAPMLKIFKFFGHHCRASLCFKKSLLLRILSLSNFDVLECRTYNLVESFDSLPALQELHLDYNIVRLFANVRTRVTNALNNLKSLNLSCICLADLTVLRGVLFLVRCCPNLEELNLNLLKSLNTEFHDVEKTDSALLLLKEQDFSDVSLNRLQKVMLNDLTGIPPEMAFVELLLKKAPSLKAVIITSIFKELSGDRVLNKLTKFWCASPNAVFKFQANIV